MEETKVPSFDGKVYKKASFWQRLLALLIDSIIVGFFLVVLFLFIPGLDTYKNVVQFIVFALYGALFISSKGATPGKMVVKIKVVSQSYEHVGFGYALLRESIGKYLSEIIFCLGYFWMLIDKRKQAWHDKIAKTFVVKLDSKGNLIAIANDQPVSAKHKIAFVFLYLLFGLPIIFAVFFLIIYIFFFRPFQIAGKAMAPNYVSRQYYLTNINFGTLSRGDVIILKEPNDFNKFFIDRVIGLPGETVMVNSGSVYVNGHILDESKYIPASIQTYGKTFLVDNQAITIPQDAYFVMGDNRPESADSRVWGFLPRKDIVSKVMFCYWNCSLSAYQ